MVNQLNKTGNGQIPLVLCSLLAKQVTFSTHTHDYRHKYHLIYLSRLHFKRLPFPVSSLYQTSLSMDLRDCSFELTVSWDDLIHRVQCSYMRVPRKICMYAFGKSQTCSLINVIASEIPLLWVYNQLILLVWYSFNIPTRKLDHSLNTIEI